VENLAAANKMQNKLLIAVAQVALSLSRSARALGNFERKYLSPPSIRPFQKLDSSQKLRERCIGIFTLVRASLPPFTGCCGSPIKFTPQLH
jgi:hypothetical protein